MLTSSKVKESNGENSKEMFLLSPVSKGGLRRSKIDIVGNGLDTFGDSRQYGIGGKGVGGSLGDNSHGSITKRGARGEQTIDALQMSQMKPFSDSMMRQSASRYFGTNQLRGSSILKQFPNFGGDNDDDQTSEELE